MDLNTRHLWYFFLSTICLHPNPVVLTVCCPVNSDSSETTPRLYECAREWSVGVHPRARQGFKLRKDFTCLGKKEGLTWNCHCIEISSLSHSLYLCSVCFLTWKKMNKSFTTCLSPSLSLCVLWGRRTWEYVQYEQHVQISDNIYIFVFTFSWLNVEWKVTCFFLLGAILFCCCRMLTHQSD